ncbi:sulfate transporter CysZ [Halotalea alkalilenta]|uniref:sulfate transporter CysZ n=1 Tax=Halotalea alkalilenta TaxID=376489 RepID=UPI0005BE4630|nr:sulfate transporter CysZ [Halotalea alkalilenta]
MLEGLNALRLGIRLVLSAGLRRYVIVPVLINLVLYAITITLLVRGFSSWMDQWMALVPSWLGWLDWLIVPLLAIALLIPAFFTFTLMVNLIASPFYGFLAEAVERRLGGGSEDSRSLGRQAIDSFKRELHKLTYILPRMALLFAAGFVPGLNLFTPFLWMLFSAWCMAIQYLDYAMDNHGVSFPRMRGLLAAGWWRTLGFGAAVSLTVWIPLLNLVVMPGAVAAGAVMWQRSYAALNAEGRSLRVKD